MRLTKATARHPMVRGRAHDPTMSGRLASGLGLGKDRGGRLHVSVVRAYVHAAIVAHDEALDGALLGMETRIDGNQPPVRLERVCRRPQDCGCEIVAQMVKNADGNGDIGRGECIAGEIADVVADELAAGTVHFPGALDVGFVAVETDVTRRLRQAAQQRARSTADVEYPIAATGPDHLVREPLQPSSCADQMVEEFVDDRVGERGPQNATLTHAILLVASARGAS